MVVLSDISCHLLSYQSLNLDGHQGITDDVATILFHLSLFVYRVYDNKTRHNFYAKYILTLYTEMWMLQTF